MNYLDIIEEIGNFVLGILLLILFCCIMAIPTWFLWNWLMPQIFGFPQINLLEAFGMLILCKILFKSKSKNND